MASRQTRIPSPGLPAYQPLPSDVEQDHPLIDPSRPGASNLIPRHRITIGPYSTQHQLVTGKSTFAPSVTAVNAAVNRRPNEDIIPTRHPYEGYRFERERLETFSDWPSNAVVSKEDLARNGFVYTHILDRVQCVFCRGVLSSWENGDVVEEEHKRTCPECAFAYGIDPCGNVPLNPAPHPQRLAPLSQTSGPPQHTSMYSKNVGPPSYNTTLNIAVVPQSLNQHSIQSPPHRSMVHHNNTVRSAETVRTPSFGNHSMRAETLQEPALLSHNRLDAIPAIDVPLPSLSTGPPSVCVPTAEPKYKDWADERLRVQSFHGWPSQMSQAPLELARAGLLYMGFGDRCKCFWCGGELFDWEQNDVPMEEHAKWFSHCNFVRQLKGNEYIQYVKDKQNGLIVEDEDIMKKPHVLAVLQDGYTPEQVQEVLKHYGPSRLYDATVLRKAIEDLRAERQAFLDRINRQPESVPCDDMEVEESLEEPRDFPSTVYLRDTSSLGSDGKSETKTKEPVSKSSNAEPSSGSSDSRPGSAKSNNSETSAPKGVEGVLKENEQLRDQRLCKICMDKELSIVFLPCGHLATCDECSEELYECPICREAISKKQKTYWS